MVYRSTQYGLITSIPLFITGIIIHFILEAFLVFDLPFLLLILMFYKLTIEVYEGKIKLIYGIGLIQFRKTILAYVDVAEVKTPWYYGYGIRLTPMGWLYNIQGSQAIRLTYIGADKIQKNIIIGTQFPNRLMTCIKNTYVLNKSRF